MKLQFEGYSTLCYLNILVYLFLQFCSFDLLFNILWLNG